MTEPKRSEFLLLWFASAAILAVYYIYRLFSELGSFVAVTPEVREFMLNRLPMFLPGLIVLTLGYIIGILLVWRWNTWGIGVILFGSILMLLFDLFNQVPMFGLFGTPWTQPFFNMVVFIIAIRSHWDYFK